MIVGLFLTLRLILIMLKCYKIFLFDCNKDLKKKSMKNYSLLRLTSLLSMYACTIATNASNENNILK